MSKLGLSNECELSPVWGLETCFLAPRRVIPAAQGKPLKTKAWEGIKNVPRMLVQLV